MNFKKRLNKFFHWLYYADSLEGKILNAILIFFVCEEILSAVVAYVNDLYSDSLNSIFWMMVCACFLLLNHKKRIKFFWVLFGLGTMSTAYAWFTFGGIAEGASYFFLYVLIIATVVAKSRDHYKYFIFIGMTIAILFYIDFYFPSLVSYPEVSSENLKKDAMYTFIGMAAVFSFSMTLLKRVIEKQRKELSFRNKELEKLDQEKTDFFTNLAHETKTPLTLIENYLLKYIKEEGEDERLSVIKENVRKLKTDMLNFLDSEKQLKGSKLYHHDKSVDLSAYSQKKLGVVREWINNAGLTLIEQIQEDIYVQLDMAALDRILNNLIDNAVKYTQLGGEIQVVLSQHAGNALLSVADNGVGVKASELENIFKPYYQINHKKLNAQGMGLGLSIVKNILDEANGRIKVESEEGQGTKIEVLLPLAAAGVEENIDTSALSTPVVRKEPTGHKVRKEEVVNKGYTILVVEDNNDMRTYLAGEMSRFYTVKTAINGRVAIDNLINDIKLPDLVLSDIMMDELDGFGFIEALTTDQRLRHIPVIFISAKGTEMERLEGMQRGAVDYINKPFSSEELLAKVKSVMNVGQAQKERLVKAMLDNLDSALIKSDGGMVSMSVIEDKFEKYGISKREKEVFQVLALGLTRKQIADKLNISDKTVGRHLENMFGKTGVSNKTNLISLLS